MSMDYAKLREQADELFPLIDGTDCSDRDKDLTKCVLHGMTISEAARAYGLSAERGRQIFVRATRKATKEKATPNQIADGTASIRACEMSIRTTNSLAHHRIETVGQLKAFIQANGEEELLRIPNFGRKSFNEVREFLKLERQPRSLGDAAAYRAGLSDAIRVIEELVEKGVSDDVGRIIMSIRALG